MKLISYSLITSPPIEAFKVSDLADIVVLAGPNGVGKTSILTSILGVFTNPGQSQKAVAVVQATHQDEERAWGQNTLRTDVPSDAQKLSTFLQRGQKRGQLKSGVINFDSGRQLEQIQPYKFSWNFQDPFLEDVGWNFSFQPMKGRLQDTIHSLHRKIRSQKEAIAVKALSMQASGESKMDLDFPDPLEKFREAFAKLLPGRILELFDEQKQTIRYRVGDTILQLDSLSSGEKEVVTIVFDFLLRDPRDCIIVFDEPELHLHPELSYRLLRTLRDVGERNQFIFSTHSPDIITASLDHSVIFVAPSNPGRQNQAVQVREDDEASKILHLIGQSVGVISLGKRIVLIEGTKSSLDKQTYGSIVGAQFPDLVLVPVGGKESIVTFVKAFETVLNRAVWGVDFFMLCDGDSSFASNAIVDAGSRLQLLPRYHLENYFLDENVLTRVFQNIGEPKGSWLLDPSSIRNTIRTIAKDSLSYAVALNVSYRIRQSAGNVDLMPSKCHGQTISELISLFEIKRLAEETRIASALDQQRVRAEVESEHTRLSELLEKDADEWRASVPGKPIFQQFAAKTPLNATILKRMYLKAAAELTPDPFAEVRDIFRHFASFSVR